MDIKVIRSEPEYRAALAEIERLVEIDPDLGTTDSETLNLLTLVVQEYEAKNFPINLPDPIDAIKYRMEQQNLSPRDLIPYIGSRSKVSEVLARKRPLTIGMIRALAMGLDIPTKVLLQESKITTSSDFDVSEFPVREMIKRGWIKASNLQNKIEEAVRIFISPLGTTETSAALLKRTYNIRSARSMDSYALIAWKAQIVRKALAEQLDTPYEQGTVTLEFMQELGHLSVSERGPLLAKDFLRSYGISLIIEPHLPRTYLDGAAMLIMTNRPIVGMTLRHDRIDNFWFCLIHELAHVSLHLGKEFTEFYDDLDFENSGDPREQEADEMAREALIPHRIWINSPASGSRSPQAVNHLAKQLQIHPAIVAGRIHHHFKSYRVLNQLVGRGKVRVLFPEFNWEE